jgi:hypothetical protein
MLLACSVRSLRRYWLDVRCGCGKTKCLPLRLLASKAHFERLRSGHTETVETSTMHLDTLRDLKSVNSHLVAAAAYPVLERTGVLLPTRLRQEG